MSNYRPSTPRNPLPEHRPGRPVRHPSLVQDILKRALARSGLDKQIARHRFVLHWAEIVGPAIAERAKPECIRNNVLVVRVTDSAWAQELSFQKRIILNRLKKFLDRDDVVNDVHFYVVGRGSSR